MEENVKVSVLVFLSVIIPIAAWNAISLSLAGSCDPTFGCVSVFIFLTQITTVYSVISTIAISAAHFFFVILRGGVVSKKGYFVLSAICVGLSVVTANIISMAGSFGILKVSIAWFVVSFLLGWVSFSAIKT